MTTLTGSSPRPPGTRQPIRGVRVTRSLEASSFGDIRRALMLRHCKWDPQVGDTATLAPFALVLEQPLWQQLANLAERLAGEALSAEHEILERPGLWRQLGLPPGARAALGDHRQPLPRVAARVVRFDFHPTHDGWRMSEANADVPGGFSEASEFPVLMAQRVPGTRPLGDPGGRLAEALHAARDTAGPVALLAATGFMEDQQVVAYLAQRLQLLGGPTCRAHPRQVHWHRGSAAIAGAMGARPTGPIVRFYQGEWMARLPRSLGWAAFFRGSQTPVCNPGSALVVESKRFPLLWNKLSAEIPTWRKLLPETRDPRHVHWRRDSRWLLKATFSNNGDAVVWRGAQDVRRWRATVWDVACHPHRWVAQRRFEPAWLDTPWGPMQACLGVYTINGRAAGVYGRLTRRRWIDHAAVDAAVLGTDHRPLGFPEDHGP